MGTTGFARGAPSHIHSPLLLLFIFNCAIIDQYLYFPGNRRPTFGLKNKNKINTVSGREIKTKS
jgi:hypothetical protein